MLRPVVSMRLPAALCLAVACLSTTATARGGAVRLAPPAAASATTGLICDLFANGYDASAVTPCVTCFDLSQDFADPALPSQAHLPEESHPGVMRSNRSRAQYASTQAARIQNTTTDLHSVLRRVALAR